MFLSLRVFAALIVGCCFAATAAAAVVTVEVTPQSISTDAGAVTGYRLYRACSGTAALVGTVTQGTPITFSHDEAAGPASVETRAFNVSGEGTGNCQVLTLPPAPPGHTTTLYTCSVPNPPGEFLCVLQ